MQFLGLAFQHGRLVGHADAFQVLVGVEVIAMRSRKMLEKLVFIPAMADVIANALGISEGQDYQVISHAIITEGAGRRGAGFFMGGFPMDDGCQTTPGIFPDAPPDAHDIATGSVHGAAAARSQPSHDFCGGSKGRDDHDVFRLQIGKFLFGWRVVQHEDTHVAQLAVHLGIVNDFA